MAELTSPTRFIADQHCRITVVGQQRRVDLAVPANAPIAEYVMQIANMSGDLYADQYSDAGGLPPAWSLALAGNPALPLESSLADAGITDGQVLYLRDAAAGEDDQPVVTDVDEAVIEAADRFSLPWTPRARAATQLAASAIWLAGTLGAFAVLSGRLPAGAPQLLGALAIVLGIVCATLAGTARQRAWPVPEWLRTVLATAAIPLLAVAGAMVAGGNPTPPVLATAAAAGGFVGALLALAACPGPVTGGLTAVAVLALIVAGVLAAVHANGTESAAAVAVVATWLYDLAPGSVAALVARTGPGQQPGLPRVVAHVRQAQQLALAWQVALAVIAAVALSWLAGSAQTFAYALAACVSLGLLLAAGGYLRVVAVLPGLAAGAVGLIGVLLLVPGRLGAPWWAGPVACAVIGLGLLATGTSRAFAAAEADGLAGVTRPRGVPRRNKRKAKPAAWPRAIAALLRVASIPLLVGVFGLFGHLVTMGRGL
jgi:type VII secretion integral membrane protein EccD